MRAEVCFACAAIFVQMRRFFAVLFHWGFIILIPSGSNLEGFGSLLDVFLLPFGCLLDAGTSLGSILFIFWIFVIFGTSPAWKPHPIWIPFRHFCRLVGGGFFVVFWVRHFLTLYNFGVHSGSNLGAFLGYLGTLKIGLKREGSTIFTLWSSFLYAWFLG